MHGWLDCMRTVFCSTTSCLIACKSSLIAIGETYRVFIAMRWQRVHRKRCGGERRSHVEKRAQHGQHGTQADQLRQLMGVARMAVARSALARRVRHRLLSVALRDWLDESTTHARLARSIAAHCRCVAVGRLLRGITRELRDRVVAADARAYALYF